MFLKKSNLLTYKYYSFNNLHTIKKETLDSFDTFEYYVILANCYKWIGVKLIYTVVAPALSVVRVALVVVVGVVDVGIVSR